MELDEIYKIIEKYGFILTADAENILREKYEYIRKEKLIDFLTSYKDLFIDGKSLEKLIDEKNDYVETIDSKIRILFDPTKRINKGEGLKDYSSFFKDRFLKLGGYIRKNIRIKEIISLSTLPLKRKLDKVEEAFVVGMIYSKKIQEDRVMVELEDESGRQRIYAFKKREPKTYLEILETPLDSVIGLRVSILPSGLYIARDVYYPSVKPKGGRADTDIYAIFTSDMHVGSSKFFEDHFKDFTRLLNGFTDDYKIKKIVRKIKYMIIGGDIVEGVGVFPEQEKELLVEDLREQYKIAYDLLKSIRKDIKIIIIPGNHDATRRSLPQPSIFEEFAKEFYRDKRFYMLGNPVNICLQGVNIYIYHGDFINDLFTITPGLNRENVGKALSILLKIRHSTPTYGLTTLIAPEKRDLLIIPERIDIFHVGHTHKLYVGKINGILAINSGTWQAQTNYQKIYGITPDPLKVPIVNLKNLETYILNLGY